MNYTDVLNREEHEAKEKQKMHSLTEFEYVNAGWTIEFIKFLKKINDIMKRYGAECDENGKSKIMFSKYINAHVHLTTDYSSYKTAEVYFTLSDKKIADAYFNGNKEKADAWINKVIEERWTMYVRSKISYLDKNYCYDECFSIKKRDEESAGIFEQTLCFIIGRGRAVNMHTIIAGDIDDYISELITLKKTEVFNG